MHWEIIQIAFITTEKRIIPAFFYMSVSGLTGTQYNMVKQYYTYGLSTREIPVLKQHRVSSKDSFHTL